MADCTEPCGEIATLRSRVDNHERRIAKHGEEIDELRIREATISVTLGRIDQTVGKIDAKLEAQERKPATRWESLVTQVLSMVVAAVVALALARIGLR